MSDTRAIGKTGRRAFTKGVIIILVIHSGVSRALIQRPHFLPPILILSSAFATASPCDFFCTQPNSTRSCTVSNPPPTAPPSSIPLFRDAPHAALGSTLRLVPTTNSLSRTRAASHSHFHCSHVREPVLNIPCLLPDSTATCQCLLMATTRSYAPRHLPKASPSLLRTMPLASQSDNPSTLLESQKWTRL